MQDQHSFISNPFPIFPMMYILQTIGGAKIKISPEKRGKIVQALEAGVSHVTVNDSYLLASTIASIIPADEFIASENMRLNSHGKFMCAHGKVHENVERCECPHDERLCDGPLVITSAPRLECPQCHALSPYEREHPYCHHCEGSLVLPPPMEREALVENNHAVPERLSTIAKRL